MIVSIVIYLSKIFEVNDMFDFEEELKKLPHVPGVYLMHDSGDHIIYVGKAIDLYNRVFPGRLQEIPEDSEDGIPYCMV